MTFKTIGWDDVTEGEFSLPKKRKKGQDYGALQHLAYRRGETHKKQLRENNQRSNKKTMRLWSSGKLENQFRKLETLKESI